MIMPANKFNISLGNSKFMAIYLMKPLKEDTKGFPGDPILKKNIFSEISGGWQHHVYAVGDHICQPHADAPKHQNPDMQDKGLEFFDKQEYIFNSACLIDLSGAPEAENFDGIRYLVEVKKEYLKPYSEIISGKGAVLIRTGYDKWLEENRPHTPANLPYLNKDAAEFLNSFNGLKVVGIDSLTVDPVGKHDSHQTLKDKFIVESIPYLHMIPRASRKNFDLQTKPVVIEGATGGPVVACAYIQS